MAAFFSSLGKTIIAGIVVLIALIFIAGNAGNMGSMPWMTFFMRYLHVLSGVMWIGLLWYLDRKSTRLNSSH